MEPTPSKPQETRPVAPRPPASGGPTLLLVALVLAALAVVFNLLYIRHVQKSVTDETFTVYKLNRPMEAGDVLEDIDLTGVDVPVRFRDSFENALDPTALRNKLAAAEPLARSARTNAVVSFDLFRTELSRQDESVPMAKTWASLPITDRSAPGGLAPGMYVNIKAPFLIPGNAAPRVIPVMERVKVTAVGQNTISEGSDRRQRAYRTVTIEVTPPQATDLATIRRLIVGEFELTLRNPADTSYVELPGPGINPEVLELVRQRVGETASDDGLPDL